MANFLVIAGSSGIGQATVAGLRAAGYRVQQTARDNSKIAADYVLDATDFAATTAVLQQAQQSMGGLDGVVNCAGSLWLKPAHATNPSQYQAVIAASLTTAFATVQAAGQTMTQGGAVVLISSAAAQTGLPNHEAIAAAKAGVIGLTLSAAATYAPQKLRVNAVAPGLTATPMTASLLANELSQKVSVAMHALGRVGTPDDVARAIIFLLDPANDWITGQVLGVDGGLGHVRPKAKA